MIDGIIKADGTSRLMRANLPATYEEFKAQAAAGTLPLDVLFNANGWSQLPTFLNKANLLKDLTANLFGLGADAVPDDVFGVLSRFQNGLGNEYVWAKNASRLIPQKTEWTQTNMAVIATKSTSQVATVQYSDTIELVDGEVRLVNPSALDLSYDTYDKVTTLVGKYFIPESTAADVWNYGNAVYYCESGSKDRGTADGYYYAQILSGKFYKMTTKDVFDVVGYVNSPYPNAYPIDDGYTYTALGQLGNKVQIATGSYTGTGTYGASNPNSIAFDFEPKLVFLVAETGGINNSELYPAAIGARYTTVPFYLLKNTYNQNWGFSSNSSYIPYGKRDGNTMYWYVEKSASYQFNNSGATYHWLAIG